MSTASPRRTSRPSSTGSSASAGPGRWWSARSAPSPAEPPGVRGGPAMTSDGGLLQDVDAAGRAEADYVGQADLGVVDLAVAGLAAEVVADLPDVGDAGGGDGVALRFEAARHVDRGGAVA